MTSVLQNVVSVINPIIKVTVCRIQSAESAVKLVEHSIIIRMIEFSSFKRQILPHFCCFRLDAFQELNLTRQKCDRFNQPKFNSS